MIFVNFMKISTKHSTFKARTKAAKDKNWGSRHLGNPFVSEFWVWYPVNLPMFKLAYCTSELQNFGGQRRSMKVFLKVPSSKSFNFDMLFIFSFSSATVTVGLLFSDGL